MEGYYDDKGEIPIDGANDANIPVDIWLMKQEDSEGKPTEVWELKADNYMPRKGRLCGDFVYRATSKDRKILADLVKKYWLPLYQTVVYKLSNIDKEVDEFSVYYWSE